MSATGTVEMVINGMVVAEIEKLFGDRLTPPERQELAARTVKIVDDYNRTVAIAAMEKAKDKMVEAAAQSAAKEPNGPK